MHTDNDCTRQTLLEACQVVLQRIVAIREEDCASPVGKKAIREASRHLASALESLKKIDQKAEQEAEQEAEQKAEQKVATEPGDDFSQFFSEVHDSQAGQIQEPQAPNSTPAPRSPPRAARPEGKVPVHPAIDPVRPYSSLPDRPPALRPKGKSPRKEPAAPARPVPVQPAAASSRSPLRPKGTPAAGSSRSSSSPPAARSPGVPPSSTSPLRPKSSSPSPPPKPSRSSSPSPPPAPSPSPSLTSETASRQKGLRGYTQSMPLSDLINFICVQGNDGVLRVTTKAETVELYFEKGHLIHARSNNTPPGYRLGEILVSQGAVDEEVLDQFLAEYGSSVPLLGEALEREQLVDQTQLQAALEQQAQSLFLRLFQQEDAYFAFSEGLPDDTDRRIHLNVTHLMLESARLQDEASAPEFADQ